MEVITTIAALRSLLSPLRSAGQNIALVPTMGALHKGHASLIEIARHQAQVVVCSIFVNPTQFTETKDLEKYPRTITQDLEVLKAINCNFVFLPEVGEMYPRPESWHIDLGPEEFLLEGASRKGHFQGVTQIVKKLFDAVNPDVAFFGQKDFQQVMMIERMVSLFDIPVKIVVCPIVREADGLAMSSRNIHLSPQERRKALVLNQALTYCRQQIELTPIADLEREAQQKISQEADVELDYFVIVDRFTLRPPLAINTHNLIALVAAKVGQTRLIDNMILC